MRWGDVYVRLSTSERAGIAAASASVPLSLVPLLKPRSPLDQGLITGLSSAMNYASTAVMHDFVLSASQGVLRAVGASTDVRSAARTTLAVDVVALAAGIGVQVVLPRQEDESNRRALARTTARRVSLAALAGVVAGSLDVLPGPAGPDRAAGRALRSVPGVVSAGAAVAVAGQYVRIRRAQAAGADLDRDRTSAGVKSFAVGALAATGAVALASVERGIAAVADRGIQRVTGQAGQGSTASHVISLAAIGGALYAVGSQFYRKVERSETVPDAALADPPASPLLSGGPGSAVAWGPLTREARRHVAAATPAAAIEAVMGEPGQDPIRLYVGLTSADTYSQRVSLAMAELERTGALDRSLLVLCSPTGTGYINYAASSTWEYLTRGDCASLTLQYSVRPSPLSLDRVDEGREQNTAMWLAVAEALGQRAPENRPRVVLFGESLGAHTSQDAFLHTGTRGLRALFVERALWIGTPYGSRWSHEIRDAARGDVRPGEVLRITRAEDLDTLAPEVAEAARYVLLSHDDDGVALFSPELLLRSPEWLGPDRPAVVPPQAAWSIPITFLQTAIDMKNAMNVVPGEFVASGHDYRADLARAVRFAYGLSCTDEQLAAVEAALRQEELDRAASWPDS